MADTETIGDILTRMRNRQQTPQMAEAAHIAGRDAFLNALHDYPIDNRRMGESWRDSFTVGETGKPHPPRSENLPFKLGSKEAVIDYAMDLIAADYPVHLREYGEAKARLEILIRLDACEKARKEGWGIERRGGPRKALGWEPG